MPLARCTRPGMAAARRSNFIFSFFPFFSFFITTRKETRARFLDGAFEEECCTLRVCNRDFRRERERKRTRERGHSLFLSLL